MKTLNGHKNNNW